MGVITTEAVPRGSKFGPIPLNLTLTDPAVLIGHMTSDTRQDVHSVKLNVCEHGEGPRLAEWVPYTQAARDEHEQNLEARLKNGQLYYRAVRDIAAHTELQVWYSEDFAQVLGVPELSCVHEKEGGGFCCLYCGENFRYPYSLRAHLRFKCDTLRKAMHMDTTRTTLTLTSRGYNSMLPTQLPIVSHVPALSLSPAGSVGSVTSSSGTPSPDGGFRSEPRIPLPEKRKLEDRNEDHESLAKRLATDLRRSKSPVSPKSMTTLSPNDSNKIIGMRDANTSDDEDTGSAFRKVERYSVPSTSGPVGPLGGPPTSLPATSIPLSQSMFAMPHTQHSRLLNAPPGLLSKPPLHSKSINPMQLSMASVYGRFPGMPGLPGGFPGGSFPAPTMSATTPYSRENISVSLLERRINKDDMPHMGYDIHNIENNNFYAKSIGPMSPKSAYMPSHNPMVGKILTGSFAPAPSLSLAQNWCAKCNASFRMTSDLVYHMRSHHKREFDPVKKKKEDKLKCEVCGESFRERHHLSRHMTSHL